MKSAFKYLLLPYILFTTISQFSQVGIGTSDPDSSTVLDLVSVDKGFLMPRLTTTQISNITSPAKGLIVFKHVGPLNKKTYLKISEIIK